MPSLAAATSADLSARTDWLADGDDRADAAQVHREPPASDRHCSADMGDYGPSLRSLGATAVFAWNRPAASSPKRRADHGDHGRARWADSELQTVGLAAPASSVPRQ